jgi:hypothetical protein
MTRFFTYNQNNSGGVFDLTDDLTYVVIVEAENADAANEKFESLGGYFNGCEGGIDCDCCGDRWYPAWSEDAGNPEPLIYGMEPAEYLTHRTYLWMQEGKNIVIHYADGRKEWF